MKMAISEERIARVGQRRQVAIPKDIMEAMKLQAGDYVAFTEKRDGVLLTPKRAVDPGDTLTREEAKIVRRGLAQLKRGESKPWRAVKNALSL